ncbi:MAG: hypothetical protein Q8P41_19420 [Pseudomonadota bacterium]|nr:hypothetical protein [Pseudomonadota bacterium]
MLRVSMNSNPSYLSDIVASGTRTFGVEPATGTQRPSAKRHLSTDDRIAPAGGFPR